MKFLSTIKSLILKVGTDRVSFREGVYETDDKKLITKIQATPAFEEGIVSVYEAPESEEVVVDATGDKDPV